MTQDEIIEMAREAHHTLVTHDYPGHLGQLNPWTLQLLTRFAALVAAQEREACAQVAMEFRRGAGNPVCGEVAAAIRARSEP